ncbi:MAG: hypothetical protein U5L45_10540 [Saprospiraceae bacterium]|nr:hypothetical protein [Saprospiraceae bacterium]
MVWCMGSHSQDCVAAFAEVWDKEDNRGEGNYIRLQRNRLDNNTIEPVYYDDKMLLGSKIYLIWIMNWHRA